MSSQRRLQRTGAAAAQCLVLLMRLRKFQSVYQIQQVGGNASGGGQRDKGEINDAFVGRVCTGWSVGQGPAKLFENRGDVVLRLVEGRP